MRGGNPDPWVSAGTTRRDGPHEIDHTLFVAHGAGLRSLAKSVTLDAPPAAVFRAWSDAEAWKAVYGPDREAIKANIDLAIGGRYEWLFDGAVGSNGCQILSYIPDRMISFSWQAPPDQPESRRKRTWVVVELSPLERDPSRTRLTLTHLGFGEGAGWDLTFEYFGTAWETVLDRMRVHFAD